MFVDGKNLAVLLLEAGLCKVFALSAERSQYGKSLFEAEEIAKNARKKLWEVSINVIFIVHLKSICVEFNPGSYVVNYGFMYALCGRQVCLGLLHGTCNF